MEAGKPSQTALLVAILRARHFLEEPEPKILRDSLAGTLSGMGELSQVRSYLDGIKAAFANLSDHETAEKFVRQLEHSVCIRARLVEEELAAAIQVGASQFVVLGAGLDSTAYRETELLRDIAVFEVDHPDSQAWKKERLAQSGIEIPENLTFVPFDFENTTSEAALSKGGVNRDQTTVFSWLGVHMYLSDEAVKSTLNVLGGFETGSILVMDFIMPEYDAASGGEDNSVADLTKIVAEMREPFLSQYMPEELGERFAAAGFSRGEFPTIKEFSAQFLDGNFERLQMHPNAQYLAIARV